MLVLPTTEIINPPSRYELALRPVVRLKMVGRFNSEVGSATGFLVSEGGGQVFLVTCWHVVAGRDFFTRRRTSWKPRKIRTEMPHVYIADNGIRYFEAHVNAEVELYSKEGTPRWREYRTDDGRPIADVVAIPVDPSEEKPWVLQSIDLTNVYPPAVGLGDKVAIVGYPTGESASLDGERSIPFWKTGFGASQLIFRLDMGVGLLVDAEAAAGMSGSPVYRAVPSAGEINEKPRANWEFEEAYRLVGVYGGRAAPGALSMAVVYSSEAVYKLVSGSRRETD